MKILKLQGTRASDVILAVLVVAITAMLVIPIPTWLLDILLVVNLSFSLVLLLVGLYMPNSLALLAFPSLLLLTTLFRLALNVASARLILSQAYAGEVINAFGSFLIRGEIIVGIIIFTIITIVNFIVIAKGSSRVSEVAARFALDALPGKQMMIDSDLRAGLLDASQARQRREDLQKESMLYGSMDGAMKFVQGDAIAGFFIILTNIIGGMYLGLSNGMSFSQAIRTYTILTVGDGLVSQIPALLISVCAGLVVTRVASSNESTLGTDLTAQLFARPGALFLSGVILILFGALPGLPLVPFSIVGVCLIIGSIWLSRRKKAEEVTDKEEVTGLPFSQTLLLTGGGTDIDGHEEAPLIISLDPLTLFRLYRVNQVKYRRWWKGYQSDYYQETGVLLPNIHVVANDVAAASSFEVYYHGSLIKGGVVPLDAVLVDINPLNAEVMGLDVVEEIDHPLTGGRVFWAAQAPALRKVLELGGVPTLDFMEYVGLLIGVFFLRHPEEIVPLSDVHAMFKQLDKKYPGIIADAFSANFISLPRFTELLHELLREGLSILDFRGIAESVAAFCATRGVTVQDEMDVPLYEIVSFVRGARKRYVLSPLLSGRHSLRAITLSEDVESALDGIAPTQQAGSLAIDPDVYEQLRRGFFELVKPFKERGLTSIGVLCRADLRPTVEQFVRSMNESLKVLSFDELATSVTVEQVGVWDM